MDALSASGLRALRFSKEVPHVGQILANDFSTDAVDSIDRNIKHNEVENIVKSNYGDAMYLFLIKHGNLYDFFRRSNRDSHS